ncbi:transketolase [Taylorella equigenitalis]|uniref:transketolase n=1 Tax=Taylorella equigenitalis TaxID=29575 RepID=UPI0023B12BBD|nr:transketolase [Taylorella equigenitalis]WEE00179.1 transketolase [Taylorella equigenitalis]WEE01656.1 transketolase [Taylorella equigenitalis]WFD78193.1 transketolase [Taylorella equigenitalis]WFD79671.1 transketolase [Taylorella equigenitalis]WFD81147.1 transketolase [Taylorella equigenitalis]
MNKPQVPDSYLANAIRSLTMDAVQKANSGHPGAPMGMAEMAVALWHKNLKHNPLNPKWYDRDRFVLSNGHASMLLYSLLFLTGYGLSIEDLKDFRQLHSKTPGHPEFGITPGVETTTGPLGQGIGNAVGFALSEALLAQEFNRDEHKIVDHFTYAFAGDGCLMEGVSHEVFSLAGTLKLNKLIVLYDSNGISIDGQIHPWFNENTKLRFESYGWQVIDGIDGHDVSAVDLAIKKAQEFSRQLDTGPTLIICKTVIGKGSQKVQGSEKAHGSPLGSDEILETRKTLGINYGDFEVPKDVLDSWSHITKGAGQQAVWDSVWASYKVQYPDLANEYERRMTGQLPSDFEAKFKTYIEQVLGEQKSIATRKSSQNVITKLAEILPELLGGSADLTSSNLTSWPEAKPVRSGTGNITFGRHINYGVREFGMAAIMNGVSLHGGYLPFGGTFLTFSDYSRNGIRMSALMNQKVVHVFTHDSIGVGEDGPTHQSIEHAWSLRLIPNLDVWRPCDTTETAYAWGSAVTRNGPSALLLSRQNLPFIARDEESLSNISKGGYVLRAIVNPKAIIIATGSEVQIAMDAQVQLKEEGIPVTVVSMPSTTVFDRQSEEYKEEVLPRKLPKIVIEAGTTGPWYKYVGLDGAVLGIDSFGESAPANDLFNYFGLTSEKLIKLVKTSIKE